MITKLYDLRYIRGLSREPSSVYDQYLTAIIVKENLSYRAAGASGPLRGYRMYIVHALPRAQITRQRVSAIDLPVAGACKRNEFSSAILSGRICPSTWQRSF